MTPDPRLAAGRALQEESDARRAATYARWAAHPETKLLISLLPPCETDVQRDCFAGLLRSAFDTGFDLGGGDVAVSFLKAMLRKPAS
jgi:hypothetical protein